MPCPGIVEVPAMNLVFLPLPRRSFLFLSALLLLAAVPVREEGTPAASGNSPRVLLLGGATVQACTPYVKRFLNGLAAVECRAAGGEDTGQALDHLETVIGRKRWDAILFAWGDDLRTAGVVPPEGKEPEGGMNPAVSLERFEENLRVLTARLRRTGAKVVGMVLPPVSSAGTHAPSGGMEAYDRVAARVMAEQGIPMEDLHAASAEKEGAPSTVEGVLLLGWKVAGAALRALGRAHPERLLPRFIPYKHTTDAGGRREVTLRLHAFFPEGWRASDRRGAVVFFFGGGWTSGDPNQFYPHCRLLAARGMAAFAAEYRVKRREGVQPPACVEDAKDAVRYVRAHAAELGVDPDRIAAGGGSAGGHLAACTAMIPDPDEDGRKTPPPSPTPRALILFNPVLDVPAFRNLSQLLGKEAERISPMHHVRPPAFRP